MELLKTDFSDRAKFSRIPESGPRRIISPVRWQMRWVLGAAGLVLLVAAAVFAWSPRLFDAVASVVVLPAAPQPGGARLLAPAGEAASAFTSRNLSSPSLITATVEALDLSSHPDFDDWSGTAAERRSFAVAQVQQRLDVRSAEQPRVVDVHFVASDRPLAASVLNDLLRRLVARVGDGGAAKRKRLTDQIAAARTEMLDRQGALRQARTAAADDDVVRAKAEAQASSLAVERALANASKARSDAALAAAGASGSSAAPRSPALQSLLAEQKQASAHAAELRTSYGPLHPQLIAAEQQLAEISGRMSVEYSRTTALLAAAGAARRRLAELDATAKEAAASRPDEAPRVDVAGFVREAAVANGRYRSLDEELQRPLPVAPMKVAILRPAHAGAWPSTPDPLMFAGAALLGAALAAGVAFWVRERFQPGFKSPADVGERLHLPVIALVPELAASARSDYPGSRPIDVFDSEPEFARAFKDMIVGIGSGASQCVAVCSAVPNEGKTTVSICLARAAAQAGLRVVLVDCDGRRRELSRLVAREGGSGLVQLIRGQVTLSEALVRDPSSAASILRHSADQHVDTELFATSDAATALLSELRERFDLVVLDTAPVLALEETRTLAKLADKVLLVARWRKTPVGATYVARDLLLKAKASIAGVALTRVRLV